MMPTLAPPSVLSAPQRRCQILLTLFQPGLTATMATFSELNGVDDDIASLDISETGREILRYHQLTLTTGYDGSYRVEGTVLNQRLCLFHWLRRGIVVKVTRNSAPLQFTLQGGGELAGNK